MTVAEAGDPMGQGPTNWGVVLCASHQPLFVAMAWLTAVSIKHHAPELPVCLCTDLTELPLAHASVFDRTLALTEIETFSSPWITGKFQKLVSLLRSPFDRTLYLDSDSEVCSPRIVEAFHALDEHDIAMVETASTNSFTRRHLNRRLYNAGVIAFRNNAGVQRLLGHWHDEARAQHRLLDTPDPIDHPALRHVSDPEIRRRLLAMDQLALVQWLSPDHNPLGLRHAALEAAFNVRNEEVPAPIVNHHRQLKRDTPARLVSATQAHPRLTAKDRPAVADFFRRYLTTPQTSARSS